MKTIRSNISILHPVPVLSKETMDYDEDYLDAYQPTIQPSRTEVNIKHRLRNNNLVAQLISLNKAQFGATVSIKGGIYRTTEIIGNDDIKLVGEYLEINQLIPVEYIEKESDTYIKPGIITTDNVKIKWSEKLGLSDFYDKDDVFDFPKNTWVADIGWYNSPPMQNLFELELDSSLEEGVFKSEIKPSEIILKIKIYLAKRTYNEAIVNPNGNSRKIIIITAFAQALKEIEQSQKRINNGEGNEEDQDLLDRAKGLQDWINSELKVPDWTSSEFNASLVASKYKKLELDKESNE